MKIKNLVLGLVLMGSLTMVGCDEELTDTSGVIDEPSVVEADGESFRDPDVVKAEEDFEALNETGDGFNMQLVADNTVEKFNNGEIEDIETYVKQYVHCMYENGAVQLNNGYELTVIEANDMILYTIGCSPNYNVNDLETKKKCAIAGLKNIIAWEKNIDTENLSFEEKTQLNGQIIFFIMQGYSTVGEAMYEPATGHIGYRINVAN